MHIESKNLTKGPATVGKRLKHWRNASRLLLLEVAIQIQVSQGSLSDLENDKSLPSGRTLTGLCKKTDLDLHWLLTGEGSMVRKEDGNHAESTAVKDLITWMQDKDFRQTIKKLIRIFEKGSPAQKAQIRGFTTGVDAGRL